METLTFLDNRNWFYSQAWQMNAIYGAVYLTISDEEYKRYPENSLASKVSYLPLKYDGLNVYVNVPFQFKYTSSI